MKIGYFFGLCAYVLGAIGGFAWAVYSKGYLIAVCVVILAWMAFPKAKAWFDALVNGKGQE